MAAVLWIAGIVNGAEGAAQAGEGFGGEGAAGSAGSLGDGGLMLGRQRAGLAEELAGVFLQGADPELLGALEVLIEVGAVTFEAFGKA